jgi:hypothetical protein
MLTTLMLAAVQAATPVPPAPPAAAPGDRTIVREIVIHEHSAGKSGAKDKGKNERREIMIIRSGDRAAAAGEADRRIRIVDVEPGKAGERREIRILRELGSAGGPRIAMVDCDSGSKVDSETVGKDGKKTRVMVCAKGGNQVDALERASKRIAENKELPDDVRTRVLAQMEAQIARLKAGK